jgi:transcriptional regulator with XRE-family HTH domain
MNLNVNLLILRLNKNLYQKDVAEALGIKVQTYQAYENHRATPPLKTIKKIIDYYGITDLHTFLFEII